MTTVEIPPGAYYDATLSASSNRWRECNLMRWQGMRLRPIGGWERISQTDFASRCAAVFKWVDNDGVQYIAYLCEEHLYVSIADGPIINITPTGGMVGPGSVVDQGGYGDLGYGDENYGDARDVVDRFRVITECYTLDVWGQDLLAMTSSDGRLLRWDPSVPGALAEAVPNAPTNNRKFVVTSERFVMLMAYGGDKRRFGWCDQEDIEDWDYATVSSKAGIYDIEPSAPIITSVYTREGVLIFTSIKAYISRFIGLPYIYTYEELAEATTPLSPQSLINTPVGAIWAGESGFWNFDGATIQALPCDVWQWVLDRIDMNSSRHYAFAVNISIQSELWWFFATGPSGICDKYVIYNYRDKWWSMGSMSRTAGAASSYTNFPVFVDNTKIYHHEVGNSYPGSAELPWAESYTLDMEDGARMMVLRQMLPDIEGDVNSIGFQFKFRDARSGPNEVSTAVLKPRTNGYLDVRRTGRDFRMRVASTRFGAFWTIGKSVFDIAPRGKK